MDHQNNFARLVGEVTTELARKVESQMKGAELPITPEQYRVMAVLWTKDGISQIELAARSRRDRASTTRIVDLLEEKRLVARIPDRNDRRINLVYLTKHGKELEKPASACVERSIADLLSPLSMDDQWNLTILLRKILKETKS